MTDIVTSQSNRRLLRIAEFFLVVCVPLATVGWGRFEASGFYSSLFGFRGVDMSIENRFTTQFGDNHGTFLRPEDPETREAFEDVWSLASRFATVRLNGKPQLIGRSAVSNAPSIKLPGPRTVYLIPESAPILAVYCSLADVAAQNCSADKVVVIGAIHDIRRWRDQREHQLRANVEIVVAVISVFLGFALMLFHKP